MIEYEVLIPLDISYPDKRKTGRSNMNSFNLDKGDFFFIEPGYWGSLPSARHGEVPVLVRPQDVGYHNGNADHLDLYDGDQAFG